jgi:hypothetical protein
MPIRRYRPGQQSIFEPMPLLTGEDGHGYDALLADVSGAVQPSDAIERIWVREIVDDSWAILQLRRALASLVSQELPSFLRRMLASIIDEHGGFSMDGRTCRQLGRAKVGCNRAREKLAHVQG